MSNSSTAVLQRLQTSAALVQRWGDTILSDGGTLKEALTFGEISFWDVIAPEIALYGLPQAFLDPKKLVTPYWKLRRAFNTWRCQRSRSRVYLGWTKPPSAPPRPIHLYCGFSPYMRRDILDPLAESLNEADEHVSTVCIVDERQADFAGQSPSCRVVWEYWDSEAEARQRQWSRQLDTLARSLDRTGVFQTMAGRAQAELRPAVMELLRSLFRHPLGRLLPYAAVARRVLDEHSPDLVLTPDVADPLCRIYLLIGRKRRIPSVELQFGCCGDNSVEWAFSLADRVAVWGDNAGATLRELGVPSERIVVTGSPRHDQMVRQDADEAERIRRRLHMPEGRTLVLFASSICNSEYGQDPSALALAKTQRVILDLAAHAPDWALVYKPHPLEDTRGIRRELGSLPNVIWAEPREDICSLIRTCDVFVSLGSSSTMDALIAQKPTICAIFPGWVWDGLFTESGAVVAVHSPEELGMALRKAVSAPQAFLESVESARQHLLQEWAFQPGGACRRINDLALNLTPPGKPRYSESAAR